MTVVREFMVRDVVTVDQELSLSKTFQIMMDRNIGSVIITEKGKPKGIFTEKDILLKVFGRGARYSEKVKKHMSTPLITIRSNQELKEAAQLMTIRNIRHLPVIDNEMLVGMVSNRDLLKVLAGNPQ
ncbi:MAG TPA: CBS domain-containing protein, partial [Nitrososphaerales archaeon]